MEALVASLRDDALAARLTGRSGHLDVGFRASDISKGAVGDALLATALLPAMREGGTLTVPGPLSPRLVRASDAIQELLLTWDRHAWRTGLQPVRVEEHTALSEPVASDGVGCYFSAGVDSFYSALRHRDEITHLVFVHGMDVPIENTVLRSRIASAVRTAADELGMELIEVEADVRHALDPVVDWRHYHGSVLAAVAHLLTSRIGKMYLPASDTFATLSPFGSHPLLDPLWGTERLDFVHDGLEATRGEKLVYLGDHDVAMRWLRVCPKNVDDAYNCGRCHKCLRTMAVLRVEGLADRCQTFDRDLDVKAFARLEPPGAQSRMLWDGYYRRLVDEGRDPRLAKAIRSLLSPRRQHMAIERTRIANRVRAIRNRSRRAGR